MHEPDRIPNASLAPLCPACGSIDVGGRDHRKRPTQLDNDAAIGYSLHRCNVCHTEFAHPRRSMRYEALSRLFPVYRRFLAPEELIGRLHHTKRCTCEWKDSAVVYQVLRQLPPNGSFLDFGAGSGYMSELARERGFTPLAVEPSEELRVFLGERIPDISVYEDLTQVRASGARASVSLAMHVIEHMEDPVQTLAELHSVTEPAGLLVVVVPNVERSYYRFGEIGHEMEDQVADNGMAFDFPPHHLTRFTGPGLQLALERAGFSNVAFDYAPVGLWDLFYDGLGDEAFRFSCYWTDRSRMPTIVRIERNLNEIVERLSLRSLGNTLIALASMERQSDQLATLLETGRRQTIETYLRSIEEELGPLPSSPDQEPTETAEERLAHAIEVKDRYIEDLVATLRRKDVELQALQEELARVINERGE